MAEEKKDEIVNQPAQNPSKDAGGENSPAGVQTPPEALTEPKVVQKEEKPQTTAQTPPQAPTEPKVVQKEENPQTTAQTPPEAAADTKAAANEEKKEPSPKAKGKPSNCASCNKSIKKKRWYYRNGKFYCSKKCWVATLKKEEKKEEGQEKK